MLSRLGFVTVAVVSVVGCGRVGFETASGDVGPSAVADSSTTADAAPPLPDGSASACAADDAREPDATFAQAMANPVPPLEEGTVTFDLVACGGDADTIYFDGLGQVAAFVTIRWDAGQGELGLELFSMDEEPLEVSEERPMPGVIEQGQGQSALFYARVTNPGATRITYQLEGEGIRP